MLSSCQGTGDTGVACRTPTSMLIWNSETRDFLCLTTLFILQFLHCPWVCYLGTNFSGQHFLLIIALQCRFFSSLFLMVIALLVNHEKKISLGIIFIVEEQLCLPFLMDHNQVSSMSHALFLLLHLRTHVSLITSHCFGNCQYGVLVGAQCMWLKAVCVGSLAWIQVNSFQMVNFQTLREIFMICTFTGFCRPQVKVNYCLTTLTSFPVDETVSLNIPWLSWNMPCRPSLSQTASSACFWLSNAGIKAM